MAENVHVDDNTLKYVKTLRLSQSSYSMDDVLGKSQNDLLCFTLTADNWQKRERDGHEGRSKQDVEQ